MSKVIKLSSSERRIAEWAVNYMRDLSADERADLFDTAAVTMPRIAPLGGGHDWLVLAECEQCVIDDLLYRIEEQLEEMGDTAHGETPAAKATSKRAARSLAAKIREAP